MATSDLYSVIQDLEVSGADIIQAETFLEQLLADKYPTMDLREGTAIRDLMIRPVASLLALLDKAIYYNYAQNTIKDITDSTPENLVDRLMSNWFLERKTGTKAVINARLFFAISKGVSIPTSTYFSPDSTIKFYPETSLVIPAESLTFDPSRGEYFIDIDLVAENEGTEYNLGSGSLLYFTLFDSYFLHGEINYLANSSSTTETNTEFVARAETAISTRNLVNRPSIDSQITEAFPVIKRLVSSGFGDPEMYRDTVITNLPGSNTPAAFHVGGKVDIYVDSPISSTPIQVELDERGTAVVTGPVYKVLRIPDVGTDTVPQNTSFVTYDTNSIEEPVTLFFKDLSNDQVTISVPGCEVQVGQYVTFTGFDPVQINKTRRVIASDHTGFTVEMPESEIGTSPFIYGKCFYTRPSSDFGFSQNGSITVDFGSTHAGQTVSLDLSYFSLVADIQEYVDSAEHNVICADYLIRGFNVYELDIVISTYAPQSVSNPEEVISKYLSSLVAGKPFVMADFISHIYDQGFTTVKTPVVITYKKYVTGNNTPITGSITDVLIPEEATCIFSLNSYTLNVENLTND